jgi:hypothetical protein
MVNTTAKKLALKTGLSPNTILKRLSKAGLKPTKSNEYKQTFGDSKMKDKQFYYNEQQAMEILKR